MKSSLSLQNLGLAIACFAIAIGLGQAKVASAADAGSRPNFIFIYSDDQRWDALGSVQKEHGDKGRFPFFQTPNMDRLAAEGVRFRNAFVTISLCAPSRAVFLTSRYSHLNGVANNHTPFPLNSVTHATELRKAGYVTGYVGKFHMGNQRERPGFDYAASFIGQGKYNDCPFVINGTDTPTKGWVDDVSTGFALNFIKTNKDKPFSLVIGFKSPHGPRTPPDRAKDRFTGSEMRSVPNMEIKAIYNQGANAAPQNDCGPREEADAADNLQGVHLAAAGKKAAKGDGTPKAKKAGPGGNLDYFRCVSAIDDDLGKILDSLQELGLAEKTVVIYTSDNGYYLGEHGLGDKRSSYEESLRIPMIVRYPKLAAKGKTCDAIVMNLDVAPTLLDLAGVPIPAQMQGKSWRPLLQNPAEKPAGWRDGYIHEYFFERGYTTPTNIAARLESTKLIKYPGHDNWTELFDVKADPYEMKNLVADAAHKDLLVKMQAEYDKLLEAIQFRIPDYADKIDAEKAAKKAAAKKGE